MAEGRVRAGTRTGITRCYEILNTPQKGYILRSKTKGKKVKKMPARRTPGRATIKNGISSNVFPMAVLHISTQQLGVTKGRFDFRMPEESLDLVDRHTALERK